MADPAQTTENLADLFPPFGLELRAGDLTLRVLRDADLPAYAALLRLPIFASRDADEVFPWYDVPVEQRVREALRFQWTLRTTVDPEAWHLSLGVFAADELIGMQDLDARDFATLRAVHSGSWLTRGAQGKGYGKLMRQAVLQFAFDHLGARTAASEAVIGNEPSFAVSRGCGYQLNGTQRQVGRGRGVTHQRFLLQRDDFVRPGVPVEVSGLTGALRTLLGAD